MLMYIYDDFNNKFKRRFNIININKQEIKREEVIYIKNYKYKNQCI